MAVGDGCLTISDGMMECVLAPGCGGSVVRLSLATPNGPFDVMRPSAPAALRPCEPLDLACFPMTPFSNRIAFGRLRYGGGTVELPVNRPPLPHPIHGHGWLLAWQVEARDAHSATLAYRHSGDAWPWAYRARQRFALHDGALVVDIEIHNESDGAMPAGFGLHPYFPKPPGTRLTAEVAAVWINDGAHIPDHRTPPPAQWDFTRGILMDDTVLDNGFTGWTGRARIDWPEGRALEIEADGAFTHLIVYAPPGQPWFCVEPASHMIDAFNRAAGGEPGTGAITLAPGARCGGRVVFRTAR
ncbi:MAG TPA: aldose 1-epimerase [Arenibaculum sp.]|nr:aldose 1-epimerase [Arenibaculum sp.]